MANAWVPGRISAQFRIEGSQIMQDVFYVVITILFFVVAAAFTRGCDKLSEE
jgi:hypothetical protein